MLLTEYLVLKWGRHVSSGIGGRANADVELLREAEVVRDEMGEAVVLFDPLGPDVETAGKRPASGSLTGRYRSTGVVYPFLQKLRVSLREVPLVEVYNALGSVFFSRQLSITTIDHKKSVLSNTTNLMAMKEMDPGTLTGFSRHGSRTAVDNMSLI